MAFRLPERDRLFFCGGRAAALHIVLEIALSSCSQPFSRPLRSATRVRRPFPSTMRAYNPAQLWTFVGGLRESATVPAHNFAGSSRHYDLRLPSKLSPCHNPTSNQ